MDQKQTCSKNGPCIAVIVPVYNTIKYLQECLDSFEQQSAQNFAVFAVDDGSTDGSERLLDDYSRKYEWLKVVHKANAGVSSARNIGLDVVENSGNYEYVTFVDSDDYVEPNYIEYLTKTLMELDLDYIVFAAKKFDKLGQKYKEITLPETSEELDNDKIVKQFFAKQPRDKNNPTITRFLGNRLFKLSTIKGMRFNESVRCCEDQEFMIESFRFLKKGRLVPEYLLNYRLRSSSLSHSDVYTTFSDLKSYERLYFKHRHVSSVVCKYLEENVWELWWQSVRKIYQDDHFKDERKYVIQLYYHLKKDGITYLNQKQRRRMFIFGLGEWVRVLYFGMRRRDRSQYEKQLNFFD